MNNPIEENKDVLPQQPVVKQTTGQKIFDILMGILLPIVCLVFAPIVFINSPEQPFVS